MVLSLYHLNHIWGEPIALDTLTIDLPLGPVCTDSRSLSKGDFFVPLQGEQHDGHLFLEDANKLGAQAAVVSRETKVPIPKGLPHWLVDDTLLAYQQLASLHRSYLKAPVIAVTGSAGKTTTRELIRSSLASLGQVTSSTKNNNNDIGVPMTLLRANSSNTAAVVVEMGMRGIGQIKRLSSCTNPDIAVITNIGSAHIGILGSRRNIAKAKCEITSALKSNGLVVIPSGDPILEEELSLVWNGRIVRVSANHDLEAKSDSHKSLLNPFPQPDFFGSIKNNGGLLDVDGMQFILPLKGRHNATNFMLALAVADELDVSWNELVNLQIDVPPGHQDCYMVGSIRVIDETYNSSPESVRAALDLLATEKGRHFAVLGTMLELGRHSVDLHRQIVEYAAQLGIDGLVVVAAGAEADVMKSAASTIRNFQIVSSPESAIKPLKSWMKPGDIVLLKASRAIAMERLIPLLDSFR